MRNPFLGRVRCFRFWMVVLLCCRPLALAAASEDAVSTDYVAHEWHQSDGLPSEQITRIVQDGAGFLWIATTSGVVRFDGSHFESYGRAADPTGKIRTMAWSPRTGLLAAPTTGGLVAWEDGAFHPWRAADFQGRRILAMLFEPGGALWLACDDGTVIRDDGGKLQLFGPESGIPASRFTTLATDGKGRVWVSGIGQVACFDHDAWRLLEEDFGGSEVRLVASTGDGPWVIARDRVCRVEGLHCTEVVGLPDRLGAHYVQSAVEDRRGMLWIATRSQGLHVVADGRRQRVPTSHEDIYALFEDREGNIWAGTNGGGLGRIRRKSYQLYDKSAGLLDNYSYTVCADARGDVWLANRDGGVVRWRGGKVEPFAGKPGWPTISAVSVFPRPGGGIGVTSGLGVFAVTDDAAPSIRRLPAIPASPIARVSYAARNGDVWLALDPARVGRLRGDSYQIFDQAQGMDGREIRAITEDKSGNVWLGSSDGKLFRFNGTRFERVPLPGLEPGAIQTIHAEDDGRVWLGTLAAGVVVWSDRKVATCSTRQGLPEADITQILPDDHGFIWFAAKHGIFRLSRTEIGAVLEGRLARVTPRTIGPGDEMRDIACSGQFQPGAWKSPDGTLWFATRRGVLAIDPTRQLAASPAPPVAIEEVVCDDRPVTLAPLLRVDARVRKLEFRFGVLSLSHPESVRAEYRLDGFDDDWIAAPANHRVAYPRLPPGTYHFRVRASLEGESAAATGATLDLLVVPRWWQTDWLRLGAILTGALAVTFMVRAWSHRRLRLQVERLERESAIRTRIAQNIHDDLGANLTHISLLTQAARRSPATSAGTFEQIHTTVSEITRSMDEIVWAVNPKFDDLESLAGYLGDFARTFLSAAGIRCRLDLPGELPGLTLASQTRHHLFLCCKEALHNIVKHSGATEATITIAVRHERLEIALADNGRGWPATPGAVTPAADRIASGNGLGSMRQRMTEIGGDFVIRSLTGGGTETVFSVECPRVSP